MWMFLLLIISIEVKTHEDGRNGDQNDEGGSLWDSTNIEVRIPSVNFQYLNWYVMAEGPECVSVVDALIHLVKMSFSYYVMICYGIITR